VLPIVVLVLAAFSTIFVRGHKRTEMSVEEQEPAVA
jgi:hypothetical protein